MSLSPEFSSRILPVPWRDVPSVADFAATGETKPFCTGVYFTPEAVIKTKNRFTPEQTWLHYQQLRASGLAVGAPPQFVRDEQGNWAEVDIRIDGPDGADFIRSTPDVLALKVYEQVMLSALDRVIDQTPGSELVWSIDAILHNFVFDPVLGKFVYIDYEPSHLTPQHAHFLQPERLVNYALVKFIREKPHLLPPAMVLTADHFDHQISAHLEALPYAQLLRDPDSNLHELLAQTFTKDDLLGLLIAWIVNLTETEMVVVGAKLVVAQLAEHLPLTARDLSQVLAYGIGKNDPQKLRQVLTWLWNG